ncbi:MAG: hypothetical protein COW75_00875 [Rhodobacterales bacterium CG18_big_fil_WC_8_21_14_2_50_71_9]|nr:MAG: hypothetical protein COW75_00875 [Rhodobacterales bacterium CG18_big_fil_WC_8_21_14_2_50_71_9]
MREHALAEFPDRRLLNLLVPDSDPDLYRFSRDHLFGSSSVAGGVVKDGNCSGPQSWRRPSDGKTIKEARGV